MKKYLIAFDDTDNLESPGTGHLLEDFRSLAAEKGWGRAERISRHQLFVHEDVPYTSHNSAMCFLLHCSIAEPDFPDRLEEEAARFLKSRSAPGSDPGLCIIDLNLLREADRFVEYGRKAKGTVLNKKLAYEMARLCGARLSEHGGTGDGVVGALAGCALRYEGEDGRLRGQLDNLPAEGIVASEEILNHPDVDRLGILRPDQEKSGIVYTEGPFELHLKDKAKTVLMGGRSVFLVYPRKDGSAYEAWTRKELKRF